MEIVNIFAHRLFAFHFENEIDNEYDRLIEQWTDVNYLMGFVKSKNLNVDITEYVQNRIEDAEQIIDLIEEISENKDIRLETFFKPLSDSEYVIVPLSLQKGKTQHIYRRNDLRIYAIRIDEDCFVITGGAIKISQSMQEDECTIEELAKLNRCKDYLNENGIFDIDSFYELLDERYGK